MRSNESPNWSTVIPQRSDDHFVHQQALLNRRRRYEYSRDTLMGQLLDIGLCVAGSKAHRWQQDVRWRLSKAMAKLRIVDRHSQGLVRLRAWQRGLEMDEQTARVA